MELSSQIQAPAALTLVKQPSVPVGYEATFMLVIKILLFLLLYFFLGLLLALMEGR
jgi:hypothetical protein